LDARDTEKGFATDGGIAAVGRFCESVERTGKILLAEFQIVGGCVACGVRLS